jgi:hypothetical protein
MKPVVDRRPGAAAQPPATRRDRFAGLRRKRASSFSYSMLFVHLCMAFAFYAADQSWLDGAVLQWFKQMITGIIHA